MKVPITLEPLTTHTQYVPLAVFGYCLTRTGFLNPVWDGIDWSMKTIVHTPSDKLQDLLMSIIAGNEALYQINTRLRPDLTLAAAWHRTKIAEQSTIADTLDALTPVQLAQLRAGTAALFGQHSQTMQHTFAERLLVIDLDPTGLSASRRAQGSRRGYFAGKKTNTGAKWSGSVYRPTTRRLVRGSTTGMSLARRRLNRPSRRCGSLWLWRRSNAGARSFAGTPVWAPTPMSTGCSGKATRC